MQTELHSTIGNATGAELRLATKLIAGAYQSRHGQFAYEAFEYINSTYFADTLPWPLVVWACTPYGKCVGLTDSGSPLPLVLLHSRAEMLASPPYAFDVLVHECIHVAVHYLHGGGTGETSHNCPEWRSEVDRLAPLLGFPTFRAGANKVKRVPIGDGSLTKTGKPATTTARVSEATFDGQPVPYAATVAGFPDGLRRHLGRAAADYQRPLPFPHALNSAAGR